MIWARPEIEVFCLVRPGYVRSCAPETIKKEPLHLTYVTPQKKKKKGKQHFIPPPLFSIDAREKEQAEALGSDPFTHFSEFEFLGQSLWPESGAVWRKLTAACKNSICHPGWETALRHVAQTSNPPNRASQTCCLNVVWGCCRSRHTSAACPSSLKINEEVIEQWGETASGWCIFTHVGLFACFTS